LADDVIGTVRLESADDIALADRMKGGREQIIRELRKLIVGQEDVIEQVLLTLFVGGNSLLMGVPGLAKTLLIHTIAQVLDLRFSRIQFTPDLMPSDITGTDIIQEDPDTGRRELVFAPGPVFSNIVLADEINRYTLDEPFYVFATQNPIELEGTYPLPEAQLDRFMFEIVIEHLSRDEEMEVVRTTTGILEPDFSHAVTGPDLVAFQRLVRRVPVSDVVLQYAVDLVRRSRPSPNGGSPDFVKKWIAYGASVRAAQYLVLGGKARAITHGRDHVTFEDIKALAHPVMRHRVLTNFHAESEGRTSGELIDMLLADVRMPTSGM